MITFLVEKRNDYTIHLVNTIAPLVFEGVRAIYKEAQSVSTDNYVLKIFQSLLKRIPKWNTSMIENETNRIGQKTKFQKGHLTSHLSGGDVSEKNIIEICQYCNTFLSDYFDIELENFKLSVNPFKAVEKSSKKIRTEVLEQLITKNFKKEEIQKILDSILKKI